MSYGFVRSTDRWGVNSIPFQQLQQSGIDNLLFNANDPNLNQALENADRRGAQSGIWIPAGNEGDPRVYAQKLSNLYKRYGNRTYVPNIEFTGKGYKGSKGWDWNEQMMSELTRLGVPPKMAVAMLPNQDDFNYKAYTSRGARIMPEAFGASTSHDQFDPEMIRQTALRNGVPENMIDVLLSPGQRGGNAVFTVDDLNPQQLAGMRGAFGQRTGGTMQTAAPKAAPSNMASLMAAVQDGLSKPQRYMMKARINPINRMAVNSTLRRQVVRKLPVQP